MTLAVTGLDAVTPVGGGFVETGAALRARLSGVVEHPFLLLRGRDPEWDPPSPLRMGMVPTLDPLLPLEDRLVALAVQAVQGLVTSARLGKRELAGAPVALGLPEDELSPMALPQRIAQAARLEGAALLSPITTDAHLALARALAQVDAVFRARQADRALVVLVDSFADRARVDRWNDAYRLRSPKNPDGFLPGEGAVALLLEPLEAGKTPSGRAPLGTLSLPTFADEPNTLASERASTGAGLTAALRGQLGERRAGWLVADLNGESYGAHEWGVTRARLGPQAAIAPLHHPLESTGDLGAATGGLLLARALHGFSRGTPPAREAVLFAGGASARGAWTVHAP